NNTAGAWGAWQQIYPKNTKYTYTTNFGTVPAKGTVVRSTTTEVFKADASYYVTFRSDLPDGVVHSFSVDRVAGTVKHKMTNITDAQIVVGSVDYILTEQRF